MSETAAIFDFDGTLFQGHLWKGLIEYHVIHKKKLPLIPTYLGTNLPLWLLNKLRFLSEESYKTRWGEDLAKFFKGLKKEEGHKIFEWVSNNYFGKLLRPNIMGLLQYHSKKGHKTVILSGSFGDFLDVIKHKFDVDYIVGTKLEVEDNTYSGKIIKPLCLGINKTKLLNEFLCQTQPDIDLSLSYAYADSILDTSLLEMVGNPVAVYPDKKLSHLAKKRGWKIIDSSESSHLENHIS